MIHKYCYINPELAGSRKAGEPSRTCVKAMLGESPYGDGRLALRDDLVLPDGGLALLPEDVLPSGKR